MSGRGAAPILFFISIFTGSMERMFPMLEIAKTLMSGFYENIVIFFWTLALAIPLGLIITLGSMSRFSPLRWLTKTFVWIIRGTPLMLQLFVVLYAPGLLPSSLVYSMNFSTKNK